MGVVDKSEVKEEQQSAADEQSRLEEQFLKDLKNDQNADKPKDDAEDPEKETPAEEEGEQSAEEEGKEDGEGQEDAGAEEGAEEEDQEEGEDPKQRRIDELTKKNKQLEQRLRNLEAKSQTTPDADREKLEKMSSAELKQLKKEVMQAWKTEQDDARSRQLMELSEKIDEVSAQAPARFERQQLSAFNAAVEETLEELGDKFDKPLQEKIYERAKAIFAKYPTLQQDVNGQAVAWQQAVDMELQLTKLGSMKEKSLQLQRDNNKLKKKTSLDTAVSKGANKQNESDRLLRKAKGGDKSAEHEFFRREFNL